MQSGPSANRVLASFVASAQPPDDAFEASRRAYLDTIGVTLAGSMEHPARLVQALVSEESPAGPARVLGTNQRTSASGAALANGTAAHALDFDDVSFVSLAHPSAPLVAAALAAGELAHAGGAALLAAYSVGFEVESVLGRAMNPSHYRRGWHCTSTIGTIGAAAAAARVCGLDADATARCMAIAASHACGLKENFGTMAKPLHAGVAARNAVQSALLAARGFSGSDTALDGAQGFIAAFDGEQRNLTPLLHDLGRRWDIVDTGITVKLYPSCAATHPMLDALLDMKRLAGFGPEDIEAIDAGVDELTPTVLLYDRPRTGLEAKFSFHYCAAAAIADGGLSLDTFDDARVLDPRLQALLPRITMRVERSLGSSAPPLTQVALTVRLRDGRELRRIAQGARGYPNRPASTAELESKFRGCAKRVLPGSVLERALECLRRLEQVSSVQSLTEILRPPARSTNPTT